MSTIVFFNGEDVWEIVSQVPTGALRSTLPLDGAATGFAQPLRTIQDQYSKFFFQYRIVLNLIFY